MKTHLQAWSVLLFVIAHETTVGQGNLLSVGNGSGMSGNVGSQVPLSLNNQTAVAALVVTLKYDTSMLTPSRLDPVNRTSGQSGLAYYVPTPGEMVITLFDFQGADLAPSSGEIAQLFFDVSPNIPPGVTPLSITEQEMSSPSYQLMPIGTQNGSFAVQANTLARPTNLSIQSIGGRAVLLWTFNSAGKPGLESPQSSAPIRVASSKKRISGGVVGDAVPGRNSLLGLHDIAEVEPNNSPAQAQVLVGDSVVVLRGKVQSIDSGTMDVEGDDVEDLFTVTTTGPGLEIVLDGFSSDCDLFLFEAGSPFNMIDAALNVSPVGPEFVSLPDLPSGTYLIGVSIFDLDPLGPDTTSYKLTARGNFKPAVPGGVQSFNVYRSGSHNARRNGIKLGSVPASVSSFLDQSGDKGTFFYQVTAMHQSGESNPSNEVQILLTAVGEEPAAMSPTRYELYQNYPNPFNPETVVRYQLPVASDVQLRIYDLLGREVATLVNARNEAGFHQVSFNATGLGSGVYLYRIQARPSPKDVGGQVGAFVETRKLLLVR